MPSLCRLPIISRSTGIAYDLSRWGADPRVLSNNKVSYDTSAMVHSHLIHLLRPYLNGSAIQQQSIRFHNVQHLRLESKAPCGGLTSEPVLSLPRGHPFIFPLSWNCVRPLTLSLRGQLISIPWQLPDESLSSLLQHCLPIQWTNH